MKALTLNQFLACTPVSYRDLPLFLVVNGVRRPALVQTIEIPADGHMVLIYADGSKDDA